LDESDYKGNTIHVEQVCPDMSCSHLVLCPMTYNPLDCHSA